MIFLLLPPAVCSCLLLPLLLPTAPAPASFATAYSPDELWHFLPFGYLLTILIEMPILLVGLSRSHPIKRRLFAGVWLTACTYPIVTLVLPLVFSSNSRTVYLLVAETFAPVAECVLFWLAFGSKQIDKAMWRDFAAIIVANLASFGVGEVLNTWRWFGLF